MIRQIIMLLCSFLFVIPLKVYALEADELLVVANKRAKGSVELAEYYMKVRNIPQSQLVVLSLPVKEVISREVYERQIRKKVRNKLSEFEEGRINGIVTVFGVPLKVLPPELSSKGKKEMRYLRKLLQTQKQDEEANKEQIKVTKQKIDKLSGTKKRAAVDSELALVKADNYPLESWIGNPYFQGFYSSPNGFSRNDVLLVSRIDGPDLDTAYRIVDDSIKVEKVGLDGVAYFDARWKLPKKKNLTGYALYDASIHHAATVTQKRLKDVILDERKELFAENSAPKTALYCGWYSYGKYIDSFDWVPGSVGYHVASAECSTLKKKDSTVWCLKMLQYGVAATIGPVYEPYVQGFPLPEMFFGALTEGSYNLGESYLLSQPFFSWQVILIGDPLYKPFKN